LLFPFFFVVELLLCEEVSAAVEAIGYSETTVRVVFVSVVELALTSDENGYGLAEASSSWVAPLAVFILLFSPPSFVIT